MAQASNLRPTRRVILIMPPHSPKGFDSIPVAVRWAIAFVLAVIVVIALRPKKAKENRPFLEDTLASEATKTTSTPAKTETAEYSEMRSLIEDSLDFRAPKLAYVPKAFEETEYDQTIQQYPLLGFLSQDGMVEFDPRLGSSAPGTSQTIAVVLTQRGQATFPGFQEYADRWELPIATRTVGFITPCRPDSNGRCAVSFSWQYASRIPRSGAIRSEPMDGRLEARKQGSSWVVERILGIHPHPLNEHDRPGGPYGLTLEPGEE